MKFKFLTFIIFVSLIHLRCDFKIIGEDTGHDPSKEKYAPAQPIKSLTEIVGTWILVEVQTYKLGGPGNPGGYSYIIPGTNPPEEVLSISNDTLKRYDYIDYDTCYQYYFGFFDSENSNIDFYTKIVDSLHHSVENIGIRCDTLQFGEGEFEYYFLRQNVSIPTNICNY